MKRKFLLYLIPVLALTGCIYPYHVDLEDSLEPSLVIDANILIGNTSTVRLSYLQPLSVGKGSSSYARPSGKVYLEDEMGNTYESIENNGTYTIPSFEAPDGMKYRLSVECDGKIYRSQWVAPVAPPVIKNIDFYANDTQVILQLSMKDDGAGSGYASAVVDEIWRFHADFIKNLDYDPETNTVSPLMNPMDAHYWCWRKYLYNSQVLIDYSGTSGELNLFPVHSFSRSDSRNHDEYHALLKVWNLTPEQYKFRKQLEDNASIGGNLFSPEPGEVRGNVYCETDPSVKVYGYVNISEVSYLEVQLDNRYSRWRTPNSLVEVPAENYRPMYEAGYSPIDYFTGSEGDQVVGWGQDRCYDCVVAGGTLEKPDFD